MRHSRLEKSLASAKVFCFIKSTLFIRTSSEEKSSGILMLSACTASNLCIGGSCNRYSSYLSYMTMNNFLQYETTSSHFQKINASFCKENFCVYFY